MIGKVEGVADLAALLTRHREEIAEEWVRRVRAEPGSPYQALPREEVLASAQRLLAGMIQAVGPGGECGPLHGYLEELSVQRVTTGFDVADVIEALLLCQEAVLPMVWRECGPDADVALEALGQLSACLRRAVAHFGSLYAVEMARRLREEQEQLTAQARRLAVLEERERLAREMHDNVAQALGYLHLKAAVVGEHLAEGREEEARAGVEELRRVAREAYTDVREAIFNLRMEGLPGTGFLPALRRYLEEYQAHYHVDIALTVGDEAPFSPEQGLQVLRIVQEALSNVRKHAGKTRASVRIWREAESLRVEVADRGRGFDPSQFRGEGRALFGLKIMRERAESIGGRLAIDSQPGEGTRVSLWVPAAPLDEGQ